MSYIVLEEGPASRTVFPHFEVETDALACAKTWRARGQRCSVQPSDAAPTAKWENGSLVWLGEARIVGTSRASG